MKKSKRTEVLKAITKNPKEKLFKTIRRRWKSFDIYGKQVEFTYKGKKTYQTSIGALFSVATRIIMCVLAAYEFYLVFGLKHPYIYKKTFLKSDYTV